MMQKQELRAQMNQIRQHLSEIERRHRSDSICRHLYALIEERLQAVSQHVVMTYMPYRAEADVYPLTGLLWESGIPAAAPKVVKLDKSLEIRLIERTEDLEAGAWGIMEPKASARQLESLADIAVVLVPGLAFDLQGGRLGYGAGFYDRFFDRFVQAGLPMPLRVGVCYSEQLVERVPMDEHDYAVDVVVTEDGAARCS